MLVDKRLSNELKKIGLTLTGTQATVMILLFENSDSQILQKQLEQTLMLSHPTIRGIVKRLVTNNLIATTPLIGDKRQICLSLTEKGQSLIAANLPAIKKQVASVEHELLRGFSQTEAKQIRLGLARILSNIAD